MEKRLVQGEVAKSIKSWNGFARKETDAIVCHNCGTRLVPPAGRPDYSCTIGVYGFMVEVKAGKTRFPFDRFTPDQKDWATDYVLNGGEYYLWLSLGKHIRNKDYPRKTWLLPIATYLMLATSLVSLSSSIPYKSTKKEIAEYGLDAVTYLRDYELSWQGHSTWKLPTTHILHRRAYECNSAVYNSDSPSNWNTDRGCGQ